MVEVRLAVKNNYSFESLLFAAMFPEANAYIILYYKRCNLRTTFTVIEYKTNVFQIETQGLWQDELTYLTNFNQRALILCMYNKWGDEILLLFDIFSQKLNICILYFYIL